MTPRLLKWKKYMITQLYSPSPEAFKPVLNSPTKLLRSKARTAGWKMLQVLYNRLLDHECQLTSSTNWYPLCRRHKFQQLLLLFLRPIGHDPPEILDLADSETGRAFHERFQVYGFEDG
ncbi:hypothetical protein KC365_g18 [Hortaea werneckii]|nr:hypothetical protein KC339_g16 [Hortaea werneckii]KAI7245936.1 hypothetical protein KC365_g18 [Hortaea werneckii]